MARAIYGTTNLSSAGVPVQFSTDSATRVLVASFHARAGNSGYAYLGTDSNVSSASGWELGPNDAETYRYRDFQSAAGMKPANHWMSATDTSQKIDYWMLLEN